MSIKTPVGAVINDDHAQDRRLEPEEDDYHALANHTTSEDDPPNILLFVVAPRDKPYQGTDILAAMQDLELKLNARGTWSYYENSDILSNNSVFRVGHLKEPGVFDIQTIDTLSTPGLVLFIQFPGPLDALTAVDRMIGIAGQLAEKLGGSVCDDHNHKMTPQLISHLREQATEYDRRMRLRN